MKPQDKASGRGKDKTPSRRIGFVQGLVSSLIAAVCVAGFLWSIDGRASVYFERLTKGKADDGRCDICQSSLGPSAVSFSAPGFNPNFNPAAQPNNITNPMYTNQTRSMAVPGLHHAPCYVYKGGRQVHEYCDGHGIVYALIHPIVATSAAIPALGEISVRVGSMNAAKMTNILAILAICCWAIAILIAYSVFFPLALGLCSLFFHGRKPKASLATIGREG